VLNIRQKTICRHHTVVAAAVDLTLALMDLLLYSVSRLATQLQRWMILLL
jgi:hypothetical protein